MKENGFGRIINVASAHGLVASPFKSAYVAAKHGVVGLTKTIALEGAEHNVTCNAICPGYVWTPLVENQIDDTAKARGISREEVIRDVLLAAQPNKRFAEVEELGALAVFLCGPGGAFDHRHRAAGRRRLDRALRLIVKCPSNKRPRVVIVGGGFGGLAAAKRLAGRDVDVTIGRPAQPPCVPAAALSGCDRSALAGRYRRADPQRSSRKPATSGCCSTR